MVCWMRSRIVALVPMRHVSERVPGKNYRDFCGKPLYFYITSTLLMCPSISQVVIDTDSARIRQETAAMFEQVRVLDRPEHLRDATVPINDVLLHDVERVPADVYVQTHSTNPLLRTETIERAISVFLDGWPELDSLFSVSRLHTRLYDAGGLPLNHDPAVLIRTQDLPPIYEENSNLYIFTASTLRERQNRIGDHPNMFEIDRAEAWDIDDEIDFAIAECLWRRRQGSA